MAKNNIKRRHSKTLDLSITKKYRPSSKNTYKDGGGAAWLFGDHNGIDKGLGWGGASIDALTDSFSSVENSVGSIGTILGGATGIINPSFANAEIADTTGIENEIDNLKNFDFTGAQDTASLLDSWNSVDWVDTGHTQQSLRGTSVGGMIGNTLGAVGSGALAGAQIGGPWGAIGGAAVGLGSALTGIFVGNKKAKDRAEELNKAAEAANVQAVNNFAFAADKMDIQNKKDMLANIIAEGGKIHIKPSKRGTFTAAAKKRGMGVQEFARKVLANKGNYSSAVVKKAQFAKNAAGWKHSLGGFLYGEGGNLYSNVPDSQTHGTEFSNGMTLVNKGGTHEQNPFEGVQMGVDTQGVPNLVEEGEVIFNDYVFSNRLHPSEKELEKANLPKRYKGHTFALIAEDIGKESSERPNDPISKRGLEDSMMKLAMVQEAQRARKGKKGTQQMMAYGGRKYVEGSFLNNPQFSIPTFDLDNSQTDWSKPFILQNPALPWQGYDMSSDLSPYLKSEAPIETGSYIPGMGVRRQAAASTSSASAEDTKKKRALPQSLKDEADKIMADIKALDMSAGEEEPEKESSLPIWMRYAPVVGSAVGAIQSIFQKPDYENADILMQEARDLSRPSVRYRALNNYLTYRPLDRNYYLNQLKGQAGATRRGIMNSGSNAGNVMAGLLAADYNAQNAVGNTLMQMEQYNDALRQRVAEFNRGTDQYNSQAAMSADAQNTQLAQNRDRLRSSLMTQAAQMREAADTALEATRSANLTNFFDNLGGIGRENMGWNWTKYLADSGAFGNLREGYPAPGMGKDGGLLTKRNRRRRR